MYWLASRYNNQSNRANYGIRKISYGNIAGDHFYDGNNTPYFFGYKIRPVVTLNNNIIVYGEMEVKNIHINLQNKNTNY